jgi:hypothetical protein
MNINLEPKIDQQLTRPDTQSRSSLTITNFFEARHPLMLECRLRVVSGRMTGAIQNGSARSQLFRGSSNLGEEALFFLISAPALGYLTYVIFHL